MASIRNSIDLQDRMSPVFRSIIKSMDSTMRVMQKLDKQANKGVQSKAYGQAEKNIKRANNELIKMQNYANKAASSSDKVADATSRISRNMSGIGSKGFNLTNLAAGLYLLKNAASTLSRIMEFPDTMKAIQYRLDVYDSSEFSGDQLFDAAYAAAQRSRSEIESTANLAARILVSGATGGSGAQSISLAETLNKASFLGGSSSGESKRALLQMSQALASGFLQGDELRAIREQTPGLTDVLARGLSSLAEKGVLPEKFMNTAAGDLKELGGESELTADRIIAAFKEMEGYVDNMFENSPKLFGQSMTIILNVWKKWLKLISQGDEGLAKINEAAWKLAEWFQSDAGTRFFNNLGNAINYLVDTTFALFDWISSIIKGFSELENSSNIVKSALVSLAFIVSAAAVYSATKWAIAWGVALWPLLLALVVLSLIIYAFYDLGYTTGEIVGSIIGSLVFLAYVLYDLVIGTIVLLGEVFLAIGTGIILIILSIVQSILWFILSVYTAIMFIYNVIFTVFKGAEGVIKLFVIGVYDLFVKMGQGILSVLFDIASVIDWIFGSNLADSVQTWIDGLGASLDTLEKTLDPMGEFEDIGGQWESSSKQILAMQRGEGEYDGWNLLDKMGSVMEGGASAMSGLADWGADSMLDPFAGYDMGNKFGSDIIDKFGEYGFDSSLSDLSGVEKALKDGIGITGGDLDSVGKIKSDVDISEEDIRLLRDIAARDFLLNVQTVTPTANIRFGDVRETADVNKIMDIIEDMVDEQLATSLVTS